MCEEEWRTTTPDTIEVLALVLTMPRELQDQIFKWCGKPGLAVLCQLNKDWHERIVPLLWREIDFVWDIYDYEEVERSRQFFAFCNTLMDEMPERWAVLAAYVRKLNLGRLYGINIVHDGDRDNCNEYTFFDDSYAAGRRNVFDVIAQFTNLDSLSVYIKNWWGFTSLETSGKALARGMMNLQSLKIGGQMSTDILLGLLAKPENIKHLSLINLIQSPGQDNGPDGIVFLSGIHDRFTSLETLHLCKLADLDGRLTDDEGDEDEDEGPTYASGMRWKFPREAEVFVLEEWAAFLLHSSSTITELTLENRYLCGSSYTDWDRQINPGTTHPAEYGAYSIRESQRLLFPVLSREWPKLTTMTLVGMGNIEDVAQAVRHLEPRVQIEHRLASLHKIEGDATPDEISTPDDFHD